MHAFEAVSRINRHVGVGQRRIQHQEVAPTCGGTDMDAKTQGPPIAGPLGSESYST